MRTGNPPVWFGVLVVFRVLRAGYRVVLLRLVQIFIGSPGTLSIQGGSQESLLSTTDHR